MQKVLHVKDRGMPFTVPLVGSLIHADESSDWTSPMTYGLQKRRQVRRCGTLGCFPVERGPYHNDLHPNVAQHWAVFIALWELKRHWKSLFGLLTSYWIANEIFDQHVTSPFIIEWGACVNLYFEIPYWKESLKYIDIFCKQAKFVKWIFMICPLIIAKNNLSYIFVLSKF